MDDHDPLVNRLRDLGHQPVDPAAASRHLTAMASAPHAHSGSWTRAKIGAAFAVGLVVGGTSLASAGALPGPAQDVAHTTLSKVGLDVPHGTERFNDPAVCGTDPATQKPFRNHGQYVKAHQGDPAAAQSRCGKPLTAGTEPDAKQPADEKQTGGSTDPTTEPAGAGKGKGGDGGSTPATSNGNGNGHGKGNGKAKSGKGRDETGDPEGPDPSETTDPKGPPPASPGKADERGPNTMAGSTTTVAPSGSTSGKGPRP